MVNRNRYANACALPCNSSLPCIIGNLLIAGSNNAYAAIGSDVCAAADMRGYIVVNHINGNTAGYTCTLSGNRYTNTDIFDMRRTISINCKVVNVHSAAVYSRISLLNNTVNCNTCAYAGTLPSNGSSIS